MAVELQGKGEEAADELGAWVVGDTRAVGRGETLARWATDHPGRHELGAVITIHVLQPNCTKVSDMRTMRMGSVGVPGSDRIRADVIGQADIETCALEAKIQAAATGEEAQ